MSRGLPSLPLPCLARLAGGAWAWVSGVIRTLNSWGSIQWVRDRLGKLDPRQALCQTISLELSVGHDDLTRGGTWFFPRESMGYVGKHQRQHQRQQQ